MKTKSIITSIAIIVAVVLIIQFITGQTTDKSASGSSAQQALSTFKKLVTEENYKSYGLKSVGAVKESTLGDAIEIFYIQLDDLKAYQAGQNTNILKSQHRVLYPILLSGNAISSAEMENVNGNWEARSFGRGQAVQNYLDDLRKWKADSLQNTFLVRIPALALEFYASQVGGKTYMAYTGNQQIANVPPGELMPMENVLVNLKQMADAYNGLPW